MSKVNSDSLPTEETNQLPTLDINDLVIHSVQDIQLNIDFYKQVQFFVASSLIKPLDFKSLEAKINNSLLLKRTGKLLKYSFFMIFIVKFQNDSPFRHELKSKLYKNYFKLFQELPIPKQEIVNYVIFSIVYISHMMMYEIFKNDRKLFDMRFVFDCYHILIFELNGIFVSDSYIKLMIERIFTSKFMEYERVQKDFLIKKRLQMKKKVNANTFLNQELQFPDLQSKPDAQELQKDIQELFKTKRKALNINNPSDDEYTPTQTQNEQYYSQIKLMLQNLRLNANQISPSTQNILQFNSQQLPFQKKLLIRYSFEKYNNRNKILEQLQKFELNKEEHLKVKQIRHQSKNIIESHDLRVPAKDYFQKNEKVDHLFKDMLELNYVLENKQEMLSQLYSSIEIIKDLEDQKKLDANIIEQKEQMKNPKYRLQKILNNKIEQENNQKFKSNEDKQKFELGSFDFKTSVIPKWAERKNNSVAQQKTNELQEEQLRNEIYNFKGKEYKEKYKNVLKYETTDTKISNIVQSLQIRQNMSQSVKKFKGK